MNLDIQPNSITVLINADSIPHAIQQLVRAKVALQTMVTPASISDEELQTLLADLAGRLTVDQPETAPMAAAEPPAKTVTGATPMVEETMSSTPPAAEASSDADPEPVPAAGNELPPLAELQGDLNKAGQDLFGSEWPQASPWLVKRFTTKFTADNIRDRLSKLTAIEVAELITRLVENAAAFQSTWAEHKATIKSKPQRRSPRRAPQKSAAEQANYARMAHPANVVYATG